MWLLIYLIVGILISYSSFKLVQNYNYRIPIENQRMILAIGFLLGVTLVSIVHFLYWVFGIGIGVVQ